MLLTLLQATAQASNAASRINVEQILDRLLNWGIEVGKDIQSASRLLLMRRICLPHGYLACTGLSIPGSCSLPASPQFCHKIVQEFQPVIHRLRLSTLP